MVTSPYDHERICSGEARLIRSALKSFASKGYTPLRYTEVEADLITICFQMEEKTIENKTAVGIFTLAVLSLKCVRVFIRKRAFYVNTGWKSSDDSRI